MICAHGLTYTYYFSRHSYSAFGAEGSCPLPDGQSLYVAAIAILPAHEQIRRRQEPRTAANPVSVTVRLSLQWRSSGSVRRGPRFSLARRRVPGFLRGLPSSPGAPTVPGDRVRRRSPCRWAGCRHGHGWLAPIARHTAAGQRLLDRGSPDPVRAGGPTAVPP